MNRIWNLLILAGIAYLIFCISDLSTRIGDLAYLFQKLPYQIFKEIDDEHKKLTHPFCSDREETDQEDEDEDDSDTNSVHVMESEEE